MDLAITTIGITLRHICHTLQPSPRSVPQGEEVVKQHRQKGETQGITLHPQASHPSLTITMKPTPHEMTRAYCMGTASLKAQWRRHCNCCRRVSH